jgi:hypothetical protein
LTFWVGYTMLTLDEEPDEDVVEAAAQPPAESGP